MNCSDFKSKYNDLNKHTMFTPEDERNIAKLINWITDHADYGDISELCKQLGVDEEWFERFYHWDGSMGVEGY